MKYTKRVFSIKIQFRKIVSQIKCMRYRMRQCLVHSNKLHIEMHFVNSNMRLIRTSAIFIAYSNFNNTKIGSQVSQTNDDMRSIFICIVGLMNANCGIIFAVLMGKLIFPVIKYEMIIIQFGLRLCIHRSSISWGMSVETNFT